MSRGENTSGYFISQPFFKPMRSKRQTARAANSATTRTMSQGIRTHLHGSGVEADRVRQLERLGVQALAGGDQEQGLPAYPLMLLSPCHEALHGGRGHVHQRRQHLGCRHRAVRGFAVRACLPLQKCAVSENTCLDVPLRKMSEWDDCAAFRPAPPFFPLRLRTLRLPLSCDIISSALAEKELVLAAGWKACNEMLQGKEVS